MIHNNVQPKNLDFINRHGENKNHSLKSLSFKGVLGSTASGFFNMIQNHEVAGPTVVNITSMVIPRTAVDYTRSKEAGIETARRETTSLVSSSLLPGFYAMGIGAVLGLFKNPLGVNSTLMANNDTVDILKNNWEKAFSSGKNEKTVIKNTLFNTLRETKRRVGERDIKFSEKVAREISEKIADVLFDKTLSSREKNKILKQLTAKGVELTGAEKLVKIYSNGKVVETSMKNLIQDLYNIPKQIFIKYKNPETVKTALEKFKSLNWKKGALGFSLAALIAVSTQFVNRYITRQKTGTDAFVGLPDYEKYQKTAFHKQEEKKKESKLLLWAEKAASVAGMGYLLGATYISSLNPKKVFNFMKNPQNIFDKLKFTGKFVNLNQLRALSAITICGRILASYDSNELRETNTRDFLSFLNWLVFGNFVANLTGNMIEGNKILNEKSSFKGGNWLKRQLHVITNTFLKTDGEIDAMKGVSKAVKKRLKINKNLSIAAGIIYSGVMLGYGIPVFNKHFTNKIVKSQSPENQPKNKEFDKIAFNNNLLQVEETLGSLSDSGSVSSAFFMMPEKNSVYDDFSKKLNK